MLACPWQRCTVHFARDMVMHCRRDQRGLVAAALREIFNAENGPAAKERATSVLAAARGGRPEGLRAAREAEEDLTAFYAFPREHWTKLRSTNPLERVNNEIGRRSDVVGIFPNDASVIRLAGALLIEQNDEWLVSAATSPPSRWPSSSPNQATQPSTSRRWHSLRPDPSRTARPRRSSLRLALRARLRENLRGNLPREVIALPAV